MRTRFTIMTPPEENSSMRYWKAARLSPCTSLLAGRTATLICEAVLNPRPNNIARLLNNNSAMPFRDWCSHTLDWHQPRRLFQDVQQLFGAIYPVAPGFADFGHNGHSL